MQGSTGIAVTDLGSNQNSAGATLTLTSITVPAGALIVVLVSEVTSASAGTIADGTNTYSTATSGAMSGAAGFGTIFYMANAAALSAATITYTKQTSGRATSMSAFYATGIATSTPLDGAVTATTAVNSASPTVTAAGAPAQTGELIVGACAYSNAVAKTLTNTGSFVTPFVNQTGQATASVGGGHLNVGGTLTPTFNPTLSGASDNITIILGFKPAGSLVGWWNLTQWAASTSKVCGNLVRQNATPSLNAERVFVCIASTGGTGQTAASEPSWTTTAQCTRGAKFTDNTVTWQEATGIAALNGDLSANTPTWNTIKNTAIVLGQVIQNVAGTLILICTTAGTAGNGAEPSWAAFTNAGATTVDNGATWTTLGASFSNWAAPHTRWGTAIASTWGQAGNAFFVASNHAEAQAAALTLITPGTNASPNFVYCVTTSNVPPGSSNRTTGGKVTTTGGSSMTVNGVAFIDGVAFSAGSGAVSNTLSIASGASNTLRLVNCALIKAGTSATTSAFQFGNQANTTVVLDNTTVQFGATGDSFAIKCPTIWRNTPSAIAGAILPTTLLNIGASATNPGNLLCTGVDFSALGSGATLVGASGSSNICVLQDCKLGASVTVAATPSQRGGVWTDVIRCDSSGTNYRHERYRYDGTQTVETTIVRTGGASDGTTPLSWKLVSTTNSKWVLPFESIPITIWVDTTGSHTVTVYGTTTGGGVPNNDDVWIEAEFLGDASSPQGSFQSTTKSDNLAASSTTNNSSDASTWGGGGAGNGFKMVTPSFTVNQKGYITVVVKVAKASSTFYIDPLIVVG